MKSSIKDKKAIAILDEWRKRVIDSNPKSNLLDCDHNSQELKGGKIKCVLCGEEILE